MADKRALTSVTGFDALKPETQRILTAIAAVPYGQVTCYRDVAAAAGLVGGARQVARALHGLSEKYELPWWRIVGADGRVKLPGNGRVEQIRLLRLEAVEVTDTGRILSPLYHPAPPVSLDLETFDDGRPMG